MSRSRRAVVGEYALIAGLTVTLAALLLVVLWPRLIVALHEAARAYPY
jgi:uncharacterized membrane protein YqjE